MLLVPCDRKDKSSPEHRNRSSSPFARGARPLPLTLNSVSLRNISKSESNVKDDDENRIIRSYLSTDSGKGKSCLERRLRLSKAVKLKKKHKKSSLQTTQSQENQSSLQVKKSKSPAKINKLQQISQITNISQVNILHDQLSKIEAKSEKIAVIDCLAMLRKHDSLLLNFVDKINCTKSDPELENRILALEANDKNC